MTYAQRPFGEKAIAETLSESLASIRRASSSAALDRFTFPKKSRTEFSGLGISPLMKRPRPVFAFSPPNQTARPAGSMASAESRFGKPPPDEVVSGLVSSARVIVRVTLRLSRSISVIVPVAPWVTKCVR